MKTNKELGYYWAIYTCRNCGTKLNVKVPYGESMYIFVPENDFNPASEKFGERIAPECEYCGGRHWLYGKKVE